MKVIASRNVALPGLRNGRWASGKSLIKRTRETAVATFETIKIARHNWVEAELQNPRRGQYR
jgi:hypothetical protein